MGKYIKLTAKPDTWFKEGTEAYHYDCDWESRTRHTVEEWEKMTDGDGCSWAICVRGTRISESLNELVPVGEEYFDGEACSTDEFIIEIVDSPN